MYFEHVIGSRDGGVSWFGVWDNWNYGTRGTAFYYLDVRGFVGVRGTGSWALDPIDPLTSFVSSSGGVISCTGDGGDTWSPVGLGLPGTRGTAGVLLDSLGTLYARFGADVYARSVADHPLRVCGPH